MKLRLRMCAKACVPMLAAVALLPVSASAVASSSIIEDPDSYRCAQPGFIDFEDLPDGADLSATAIQGVQFTTTGGYTWKVGDFASGNYNGKYPNGGYTSKGDHWAWLGEEQGAGRIDFPGGRVSFFSFLTSADTPVYLEAYDSKGQLLETAGPAPLTYQTGSMSELKIQRTRADIDHVIIHDSGNYFTVDAICTDARGVASPQTHVALLGDSYSAGVGLGKVTPGCDRDAGAYGHLALQRLQKKHGTAFATTDVTCSGAVTVDYWNGSATSPVQRDAITPSTEIVALTFGGNDIYFAERLIDCWGFCTEQYRNIEASYGEHTMSWDWLHLRLVNMYVDARQRMSRTGHVYVLSYPTPFSEAKPRGKVMCELMSERDQLAANATSTRIGDTTWWAVQTANAQLEEMGIPGNIEFLDWRTGSRVSESYEAPNGQKFDAHRWSPNGLCTRTAGEKPFIQGYIDESNRKQTRNNSFHPTSYGYDYAADLLADAIERDFGLSGG